MVRVQTMTATMPLVWTLFQIMCFVASSERLELSTFPIELERIQFTRGMMFDLQTSSSDVFLEQIDQSIAGRFTEEESYGVQVYTRPGSHVSFEESDDGWFLSLSTTVVRSNSLPIPIPISIPIPANSVLGVYIYMEPSSEAAVDLPIPFERASTLLDSFYESDSGSNLFYFQGTSLTDLWSGVELPEQSIWGGTIYFRIAGNPTSMPSNFPTQEPSTSAPTKLPTDNPTPTPTKQPTKSPTLKPTASPTKQPTKSPTLEPTPSPTKHHTESPTLLPSSSPTKQHTESPTLLPSSSPTKQHMENPTLLPSSSPTKQRTENPTHLPSSSPTKQHTESPSLAPTSPPTKQHTENPTLASTPSPTKQTTESPIVEPTQSLSTRPTKSPSLKPTLLLTTQPTESPTFKSTNYPTKIHTFEPSMRPIQQPAEDSSNRPTEFRTFYPTTHNSSMPSITPTIKASPSPSKLMPNTSVNPSLVKTIHPTHSPSVQSLRPSTKNPTRPFKSSQQPSSITRSPANISESTSNDDTALIGTLTAVSSFTVLCLAALTMVRRRWKQRASELLASPIPTRGGDFSALSPFSKSSPPQGGNLSQEIFDDESSAAISHNLVTGAYMNEDNDPESSTEGFGSFDHGNNNRKASIDESSNDIDNDLYFHR